MKQAYEHKSFQRKSLHLIDIMNSIVDDYSLQGYRLTVRQLYYQLVARDIIDNTERSYKNITSLVNDARLAGLMDWDAIEDRTRGFITVPSWDSPESILRSAARSYHEDMWTDQDTRVFVIVEKEALVGILQRVCEEYDVPLLAARGYPSGTVLREFAQEHLIPALNDDQNCVILHLGDHDPSGIDMTRDLRERIEMFAETDSYVELKRIALNMPQIEELEPPENPAKTTDARFDSYRRRYGTSSWELDALPPEYLSKLVSDQIENHIDHGTWDTRRAEIDDTKDRLYKVARDFA